STVSGPSGDPDWSAQIDPKRHPSGVTAPTCCAPEIGTVGTDRPCVIVVKREPTHHDLVLRPQKVCVHLSALKFGQTYRPEFERELYKLAGEAKRNPIIVVIHRRSSIQANVEGFVDCHQDWRRVRNGFVGDCGAVDL